MMSVLTQTSAIHRQRKIRLHIFDDVGVAELNIKGKGGRWSERRGRWAPPRFELPIAGVRARGANH